MRRLVDGDLLGLGIELAEAAAARIDVEPEIALAVHREPVRVGGAAVGAVDLEEFHVAGLGVDAADGDELVGRVRGKPEIAVKIHAAIVLQQRDARRGPERPIRAVVGLLTCADADVRILRDIVGGPHHARGVARRPRPLRDLDRALARPAHLGEVGGELLLIELDDLVGLGVGRNDAGIHHDLHQVHGAERNDDQQHDDPAHADDANRAVTRLAELRGLVWDG